MASNSFFIALGIPDNCLENTTHIKYTLPSEKYKKSLDTSTLPKSLSLHCKQINGVKKKVDGEPSSPLTSMQVSGYTAAFTPMHLVFLEQDTYHCHLDFKLLDDNSNPVIPKKFHVQLLNKDDKCIR